VVRRADRCLGPTYRACCASLEPNGGLTFGGAYSYGPNHLQPRDEYAAYGRYQWYGAVNSTGTIKGPDPVGFVRSEPDQGLCGGRYGIRTHGDPEATTAFEAEF